LVRALARQSGPLLTLAALILAWQLAVMLFAIPIYLAPAPTDVAATFVNQWTIVLEDARVTGIEVAVSYVSCVLIGIPLGIAAVKSRVFSRTVYPLLIGSQSIPVLAAAPLLIVWFGFGLTSKIVVAFLITFFPIVVGTAVGLRAVHPDTMALGRSIGLGAIEIFLKMELPAALPSLFAGLKIATTVAIVGAVVGEFLSSSAGLGYRAIVATGTLDTPLLFAALVTMAGMGLVFYAFVSLLERIAVPWQVQR
jgi:NitT/TauT family transport system permease protein